MEGNSVQNNDYILEPRGRLEMIGDKYVRKRIRGRLGVVEIEIE